METMPKGTLSESRGDSATVTITKEATIKVVDPTPAAELVKIDSTQKPTITKEPIQALSDPINEAPKKKEPCMVCKAKSIASLGFSFSLIILVLAFSFSLVKTTK